jgi:hypothetical protein
VTSAVVVFSSSSAIFSIYLSLSVFDPPFLAIHRRRRSFSVGASIKALSSLSLLCLLNPLSLFFRVCFLKDFEAKNLKDIRYARARKRIKERLFRERQRHTHTHTERSFVFKSEQCYALLPRA